MAPSIRESSKARFPVAVAILLGILPLHPPSAAAVGRPATPTAIQFLGEARLPAGSAYQGYPVGGLSALVYDAGSASFRALSDDPSGWAPARFFTLELDLDDGRLREGGTRLTGVTLLRDSEGQTYPPGSLDPEGLALGEDGNLFLSSEGQIALGVPPFIAQFDSGGRELRRLPLPRRYLPRRRGGRGVRHNLAFESLCLTPDGRSLFSASENALVQDGPAADPTRSSPARILRLDPRRGRPTGEYLYFVEPVHAAPEPPGALAVSGLVELLPLDGHNLLALERSFSMGVGNAVRLFSVDLSKATDIRGRKRLTGRALRKIQPAAKRLLLDFAELGLQLDNLEGMAWGPELADGRRTLIVVSDDNFSPHVQVTQFLAFAVDFRTVTIPRVQGAGHESPLRGSWVFQLGGTATMVNEEEGREGFWLQDPVGDGDEATSDGLFVRFHSPRARVEPGDRVVVSGRVEEAGRPEDLSLTQIVAREVLVASSGRELPDAVLLGEQGRRPPGGPVDDDGLTLFEPLLDPADFFESLEGMRVAVSSPMVVGPNSRWGELVVVTDRGWGLAPRSAVGGLLVGPDNDHPQRIVVRSGPQATLPLAAVGDCFRGSLVGVMGYAFGRPMLEVSLEPPPLERHCYGLPARARPRATPGLRVATYNLLNLDARDPELKFDRLARDIVDELAAPDLLALQEIQDDSGTADDGVTGADGTLRRLIAAIAAAGGPLYEYRQIDPEDGRDGGAPGGNIRVAYLFRPDRVRFVDRGKAGPADATRPLASEGEVTLDLSPGRIGPGHPAFAESPESGFSGTRKPLAAEIEAAGRRVFLVNLHLNSKGGDDPLFGRTQPPQRRTEIQRRQQAQVVAEFVRELLSLDPEAALIVLGDFNDYEFSEPLRTLKEAGLVNLTERIPPAERYSFIHSGLSGQLDHILVSPSLAAGSGIARVKHLNADRPDLERASDHDPVLAVIERADGDY